MFMFSIDVTFRLVIKSPKVEKTSLFRGKICRQDPTFGSLKRGFRYIGVHYIGVHYIGVHYIRVHYIRVMCHTNYYNFAGTKECTSLLRELCYIRVRSTGVPLYYTETNYLCL